MSMGLRFRPPLAGFAGPCLLTTANKPPSGRVVSKGKAPPNAGARDSQAAEPIGRDCSPPPMAAPDGSARINTPRERLHEMNAPRSDATKDVILAGFLIPDHRQCVVVDRR
jgi:hypothetical protein